MIPIKLGSNKSKKFQEEIISSLPIDFDVSPVRKDDQVFKDESIKTYQSPVIDVVFADYIFLVLVFATAFGLKKFLESFTSEAGKIFAQKLFKPAREKEKTKAEVKRRYDIKHKDIKFFVAYRIRIRIEEAKVTKDIEFGDFPNEQSNPLESDESFRKYLITQLQNILLNFNETRE